MRASNIPFTLLRNGWYLENYTEQLPITLQRRVIVGSAGDGKVSAASRADYAEAAAVVLTTDGNAGAIYELGGDSAFSQTELAAEITAQTGTKIEYQNVPIAAYKQILLDAGLPEPVAAMVADIDRAVSDGELLVTSGDLAQLIGHPTTTLTDAIRSALATT